MGDLWAEAQAAGNLGALANMRGDYERGERIHQDALAMQREFRNPRGIGAALLNLGEIRLFKRDWQAAIHCFDEALANYQEVGDDRGAAMVEARIARVAFERGDLAASRELFADALRLLQRVGDLFGLLEAIEEFAATLVNDPDARLVATLSGAAAALRVQLDSPRRDSERPGYDAAIEQLRRSLAKAEFEGAFAQGERMKPAEIVAFAQALPAPAPQPLPAERAPQPAKPRLSDRELDVLRLVAAGHSNREIADALFITVKAVEWHLGNSYRKLDIRGRGQLAGAL
jgi:DNA-binding CsgD family transcriptional regulator